MIDKKDVLSNLTELDRVDIELGCGPNKKHENAIGIDILDYDGVDIVGDIFEILQEIPDNSVTSYYSYHFFEHIQEIDILISEIYRTLSVNGTILIVVPHFSNPFFYSDLTHKVFFGLYSFSYCSNNEFKRKVPNYQNKILFEQESVRLIFKSYPPRYIRHTIKKLFGFIFNINKYMQELYEENFVYIIPCYEVKYSLKKKLL